MKTYLMVLFLVLAFCSIAFAQSPCDAPLQTTTVFVTDPSHSVLAKIANFNGTTLGTPLWTESELKVVAKGAGSGAAPVGTVLVNPKSAWVLVTGTTDCYQIGTVGQFLFGVPLDTEFELWVRLRNQAAGFTSPWSTNAVPFGRPATPAAPSGIHITRLACDGLSRLLGRNACSSRLSSKAPGLRSN